MKADPTTTKTLIGVIALTSALAWSCSDSHDEGTHDAGAHTSPYPSCNEITQKCHAVDTGDGDIHECHDKGHAAKSDSDCSAIKDNCLKICAEAAADAGIEAGH